ncbi:type VII toxin-antitoxin system MntA family adenylyltransferase antitoxin [Sporosarcina sp. FSL K6-3457]|uniref:type VII toxin-antitoxin system MntA family adenylyltransferase antitoxin n=1 Tax=Sporosarcina sp. FSL K6-3457 TaxID=2978204 RepID=UPI0030F8B08C
MRKEGDKHAIQKKLVDKINLETSPAFIILFGSFAKSTTPDKSDIDLAYFSDRQLSSYERFMLASELAAIAGREVDLVDIKQIDTVFTIQIFEQGNPIYIHDKNEFTRQKMRAYSMYATLSEQRAAIIDAIKERGSVFGNG